MRISRYVYASGCRAGTSTSRRAVSYARDTPLLENAATVAHWGPGAIAGIALLTMPVGGVVGKRQLFRPDGPLVSEIGFGAWCVSPSVDAATVQAQPFARTQRSMPRCAVLILVEAHTTLTFDRLGSVCHTCIHVTRNRPIGGAFGAVERRTGIATVQAAVRVGASFIDTADCER